jgi:hypothetical protein
MARRGVGLRSHRRSPIQTQPDAGTAALRHCCTNAATTTQSRNGRSLMGWREDSPQGGRGRSHSQLTLYARRRFCAGLRSTGREFGFADSGHRTEGSGGSTRKSSGWSATPAMAWHGPDQIALLTSQSVCRRHPIHHCSAYGLRVKARRTSQPYPDTTNPPGQWEFDATVADCFHVQAIVYASLGSPGKQ